jgi:hypothetical protein
MQLTDIIHLLLELNRVVRFSIEPVTVTMRL